MQQWHLLPPEVVFNIYELLELPDRNRASRTCKNWRRVYFEPALWRTVRINLRCDASQDSARAESMYTLSHYLRGTTSRLEISCPRPLPERASCVARCIHSLLSGISMNRTHRGSTLRVLAIDHLYYEKRWAEFDASKCLIVSAIADFLESQKRLKIVALRHARMDPTRGNQILSSFKRSRSTESLKVLDLSYFYSPVPLDQNNKLLVKSFLSSCQKLKEVYIDLSFLKTMQVVTVCELLESSLKTLTIYARSHADFASAIEEVEWRQACTVCPRLKVSLKVRGQQLGSEAMITPGIPLKSFSCSIQLNLHLNESAGRQANALLDRLAACCMTTLKKVRIKLTSNQPFTTAPSVDSIVNLLQKCQKLKSLSFNTEFLNKGTLTIYRTVIPFATNRDANVLRIF